MNMPKLFITRFPLESGSGGEEELHFLLAEEFSQKKIQTALWSSCSTFLQGFQKRHFFSVPAFFVPDPTSKISIILLPITLPILLLQAIIVLPYFSLRGYTTILMLTFFEKCFLTPICHLLGFRVVWAHHAPLGKWFFKNPILPLWKRWSKKVKIIVPSSAMEFELKKICPEKNIIVISNAIRNLPEPDTRFQKKLLQIQKGKAIGTVGRLSKEKNLTAFLETASYFPQETFFIAGDGPKRYELEKIIGEKGIQNVILLGHLKNSELSALYSVLDVYVSCSDYETFGLSIAEAASFAVPAVAPRVGGIPDIVKDGKTGFLYNPSHPDRKNEQINVLLKDEKKRKKMGIQAQEYAVRFQKEAYFQSMKKILFPTMNMA